MHILKALIRFDMCGMLIMCNLSEQVRVDIHNAHSSFSQMFAAFLKPDGAGEAALTFGFVAKMCSSTACRSEAFAVPAYQGLFVEELHD